LADEIIYHLLQNAPTLDVIERERIDDLLREQNLVQRNIVDPASAISLGRLLGVRAICTGSISLSIETIAPTWDNRQRVAVGSAVMRVIDTETGKIIWSQREKSQFSTFLGSGAEGYLAVRTDQEMIQVLIEELAQSLAQAFYEHYEYQ
jgi:curli biogenesis system outer membrane secretion channel CsgG